MPLQRQSECGSQSDCGGTSTGPPAVQCYNLEFKLVVFRALLLYYVLVRDTGTMTASGFQ